MRESLIKCNSDMNKLYSKLSVYQFDYEVNTYQENGTEERNDVFCDDLAPRFYKCEKIGFFQRKWLKSLVSKNKIRLINKQYDLDLM